MLNILRRVLLRFKMLISVYSEGKIILTLKIILLPGDQMSVVKVIELVGSSEKNWEDAVQNTLKEAEKTVKNIVGIDVLGYKGDVKENKIVRFKAHVKIAFAVKR